MTFSSNKPENLIYEWDESVCVLSVLYMPSFVSEYDLKKQQQKNGQKMTTMVQTLYMHIAVQLCTNSCLEWKKCLQLKTKSHLTDNKVLLYHLLLGVRFSAVFSVFLSCH